MFAPNLHKRLEIVLIFLDISILEDQENIARSQSISQRRSIIQRMSSAMQTLPEKDDTDSINSVSLEPTGVDTIEKNEKKVR